MKERPILFNGAMVRAILEGRKTQTRRTIKPVPQMVSDKSTKPREGEPASLARLMEQSGRACPFGQPGDRLWVRETFCPIYPQEPTYNGGRPIGYDYAATYVHGTRMSDLMGIKKKWTPSIHMTRRASRILLEIVSVRIERLNDISEADAAAEGIGPGDLASGPAYHPPITQVCRHCGATRSNHIGIADACRGGSGQSFSNATAKGGFSYLWEQINGPYSWAANPWVWVVEFKCVEVARK